MSYWFLNSLLSIQWNICNFKNQSQTIKYFQIGALLLPLPLTGELVSSLSLFSKFNDLFGWTWGLLINRLPFVLVLGSDTYSGSASQSISSCKSLSGSHWQWHWLPHELVQHPKQLSSRASMVLADISLISALAGFLVRPILTGIFFGDIM